MSMTKIQANVFKIYIILLPFTTILGGYSILGAIGNSYSIIFQVIGIILIFLNLKHESLRMNKLIKYILVMVCLLNISSIFMATILNNKLGVLHGENTYRAISGETISYFQIAVIFYYNYFYAQKISLSELKKLLYIIAVILLVIGYMQIGVINIPIIGVLYDKLNFANILKGSEDLIRVGRIVLTGPEPSSIAESVGILIFPFLISQILINNKKYTNWILVILYIPVLFFSKSSATYIAIVTNLVLFVILANRYKVNIKYLVIGVYIMITIGLGYTLISSNLQINRNDNISNIIEYYLVNKISDNSNLSTAHRKSTLINNIDVFTRYPLLGIGNGNQGFYYNENLPEYAYYSRESMDIYYGSQGVVGSGAFFMGYLSSYGIVGAILLLIFVIKSLNEFKYSNNKLEGFKYMYIIGGITFLVQSIMSSNIVGNYIVIFVLSIPFFIRNSGNTLGRS